MRNKDELLAALVHDVLNPTVRLLEEVAELMVELALSGVRRSDERSVDAVALLKEDLAHLERTLSGTPPPLDPRHPVTPLASSASARWAPR